MFRWLEACLQEELPAASLIENELRNGVMMAKLAHFFAPKVVQLRNIYDMDLAVYKASNAVSECSVSCSTIEIG